MTTFQSALDRISKAAQTAGIEVGQAASSPFERISSAVASVEPGAAPGMAASEQDIMGIAAREYEDQLLIPKLPMAAKVATLRLEPREIERGLRTQMTQAAQAVATPGLRAQFIESVLDPLLAVTFPMAYGSLPRPVKTLMARGVSQALEPSGSGLSVEDLRTEQVAARGAAAGMAAGQEQGFAGEVARGVGQSIPQFLGVAGAVATGQVPAAAAIASQALIPLSAWTGGQLAYMDELDAKRAEDALSGKELSQFDLGEMRRRATASAAIQTGVEVIGAGVGAKAVGTVAGRIAATKPGRAVIARLSEAGQPLVARALASKAGQAGTEAFARATNATGRIGSGFLGNAGKIVAISGTEEGAEELATAILESPFTEAPLSDDLKNGVYAAFVGAAAGGVGGVGAVGGAVARKAIVNRREAFRPENDAEIRLRQMHTEAQKARTNWTEDLDESQQAQVSVALNSLNGMAPEERGIFLRDLSDIRSDIESRVEKLLARRQELDAALAGARDAQRTYEAGAPERAAKETLVSEAQSAFDKASEDLRAAQELLTEAESEAQKRPRVARPGRVVVSTEQRQANLEAARSEVAAAQARLESAAQEAGVAEGLEIAPGLRIDPAATVAGIERDIASTDEEMRLLVTDRLVADATYNAVREKISDMPMEYRQQEPSAVLSGIGTSSGVQLDEVKAPKRGGRITREMEALGVRVVWFRGKDKKFGAPAFHSMESRGVVYLNADANMSQVRAKAFHELFHDIQMFRPEIAKAYADRVGIAPIYEAGAKYARGRAESASKQRMDALARIQAAAAGAGLAGVEVAVPAATARAGAARLQQEGEAEAFGATAAQVTGRGVLTPFVQFAARRGLMGRDVAAAMAVIDMASRAAAVERVSGVKPVATLSPLARTLLWAEDINVLYAREIEETDRLISRPVQVGVPSQVALKGDRQYAEAEQPIERAAGDRGWIGTVRSLAPLEGAPRVSGATGPDPNLVAVAEQYAADNGITLRRQAYYAKVDEDRARRIAEAYDAMPHAPNDPIVREAYENLIKQTMAQYRALERAGYSFYFYDETTDPYDGKPWNAMRDLRSNKRMAVFTSEAGFGTEPTDVSDNPLLAETGLSWPYGSPDGPRKRVLANDLFRAVHDAFGHGLEGAGFRADGEENAWQAHVRLFTGSAVGALTSETRGQNSWLNYGPYGEANRTAAVEDTTFATQKSGLMPSWTWQEGRVPDVSTSGISMARASDAEYLAAVERGDMDTAQRMVDEAKKAQQQAKQYSDHPIYERWKDVLAAVGATITNPRDSRSTMSDYANVKLGNRTVELRGSDHGNWPNPRTSETVRNAYQLRYTAPGFERAFALWLGFSEEQIRGLKLNTQRDRKSLASIKPVISAEVAEAAVIRDEAGNIIPLSKRFDVSRPEISYARASDKEYFAAIERGDMTAVQRMVDAAAKAAGYIYRVFHGTNAPPFDVFDMEMGGTKTGADSARIGFFASDNQKVAQSYADNIGMGGAIDLALGGPLSAMRDKALETGRGKELKDAYLAAKSEYDAALKAGRERVRVNVANSDAIARLKSAGFENQIDGFIESLSMAEIMKGDWLESEDIVAAESKLTEAQKPLSEFVNDVLVSSLPNRRVLNLYAKMDNPAIYDAEGKTPAEFSLTPKIQKAVNDGHDGVIFKNLIDPVEPSTHYVVFKSSQFKSSDPIVRDEAGNIIPLSKRFDVSRPEISYARSDEDAEVDSLRKQIADLQRQVRDVQNVTAAQRANALREVRVLERRLVTAERIAEQKTLQATRAKMRLELERQAAQEDVAAVERDMAKVTSKLDASQAAVKQMRVELSALRRGERLEERLADAERTAQRAIDWAYAIGRNEGLLAGEVRGQQVERRQVRKLSQRLDEVQARLDKAIPALREARAQIKSDSAAAQRAIDFAYGMGLAKGRIQGVMEGRRQVLKRMARREDVLQNQLFNLRKVMQERAERAEDVRDAAQAIARDAARMLPEKLRGPLAVRIANVKTPEQANRIAIVAVKLAVDSEVNESIAAIARLRKQLKKRGMRYATRQRVESLLDSAEAGLRTASGRRIRAVVTPGKGPKAGPIGPAIENAVDIYAAVVDAASKVEQATLLYQLDRTGYLAERAQRIARYNALRDDLVNAMSGRPTLEERERSDLPPRLPIAKRIARANSDIYTLMLELEGTSTGVINELLSKAQAGKGEASLEHASILRQIIPALQAAGYSGISDYALKNGLLGQASAQVRTVQFGGEDVTVPVGTILSIAAMDDETLSLFPSAAGERGQSIKFPDSGTTREFYPTHQDIAAIRSGLSAEERGLVDAMKNILETQVRDRVFESVFLVEGDMPPVVNNYWPRVRETQMKADANILQQTAGNLVRSALTSVGFAQARIGGTMKPLLYSDAFQTWERHVQVSLDMIHMAQPYRDAATVLTDPAVVRGLDMQMGKGTAEGLLAIFSNGVGATARSNPTLIDKLTNNITGAILAMRPRTLGKVVVGGQIRLMSEIPVEYMARGVARSTKPRTPQSWNARIDEIHAVNGYFNRRHQLHMRSIISGSLSDADRVKVSTAWQASIDSLRATGNNLAAAQLTDAFENFKDAGNGANLMIAAAVDALRYMDEQIMLTAVEARLAEVEDEGVLDGQDALREAALRAERDFRRTQNASDEFDDTFFAATSRVKGQQGWRLLLPFTSDPLKARNQIRRAYLSGDRRLETAAAIGGNAAASTIIGSASLVTVGYMVSLIAGLLGGDEPTDEEEKKFKEEAKKIPARLAAEILSSTAGIPGVIMGQVVQGMQYRRQLFAPLLGRPIEQAGREMTADDLPVLVRIIPATLALTQYLGFPMYGLYEFVKDFIPESEKTPQEKIRERIERRRESMTPEKIRERIQRRISQ